MRSFAFFERTHPVLDLDRVGDQVVVREHRCLRHAGRAAGVLEEGDIVRINRHARRRLGVLVEQLLERIDAVAQRHVDHLAVLFDRALYQRIEGRGHVIGHVAIMTRLTCVWSWTSLSLS